jgi:hypothetical protein
MRYIHDSTISDERSIFRKKVPQSNLGSLLLLQRIEELSWTKYLSTWLKAQWSCDLFNEPTFDMDMCSSTLNVYFMSPHVVIKNAPDFKCLQTTMMHITH